MRPQVKWLGTKIRMHVYERSFKLIFVNIFDSHSHCLLILDPGSAYYDDFGGGFAPSEVIIKCRYRIKDQEAVAVAIKKINKNDLSYTCTLILVPNHLTWGRTTQARDHSVFSC